MGGSVGTSESNSNNAFSQRVPEWQKSALIQMFGQAANLYGNTNNQLQSQIPGATNYMQTAANAAIPAYQDNLRGGAYTNMNLANNLSNSLQQSLSTPSAMQEINASIMGGTGNNYADAMKASYITDANRAQQSMLSNLDARASASGMSGGSRHGVATAQGMNDINSNLQRNLAETGYNTFDKDLQRKLGIASQADQGTLARQGMMQSMLGQQQGTINNAIQQGSQIQNLGMGQFAPSMVPWQALGQYAQALGNPIILGSGHGNSNANSMSVSAGVGGGK